MARFLIIMVLSAGAILFSCRVAKKGASGGPAVDYAAAGYVKAEIKKYEVEACGYLLFLENGQKLKPATLGEEFKKEGLTVWIKYTVSKQGISTCMAGQNIVLTDIKPYK
jgi:hypothetical protein